MRIWVTFITLIVLSGAFVASAFELDHCEHETQSREQHSSKESPNCVNYCSIYHHVTLPQIQADLAQMDYLSVMSELEFYLDLDPSDFSPKLDRPPIA